MTLHRDEIQGQPEALGRSFAGPGRVLEGNGPGRRIQLGLHHEVIQRRHSQASAAAAVNDALV
jgi:hypothetical protein